MCKGSGNQLDRDTLVGAEYAGGTSAPPQHVPLDSDASTEPRGKHG